MPASPSPTTRTQVKSHTLSYFHGKVKVRAETTFFNFSSGKGQPCSLFSMTGRVWLFLKTFYFKKYYFIHRSFAWWYACGVRTMPIETKRGHQSRWNLATAAVNLCHILGMETSSSPRAASALTNQASLQPLEFAVLKILFRFFFLELHVAQAVPELTLWTWMILNFCSSC